MKLLDPCSAPPMGVVSTIDFGDTIFRPFVQKKKTIVGMTVTPPI